MEERLAAIGRHIDDLYANALYAKAQLGVAETRPRIQRHLDLLWQKEVSARAAVRDAYGASRRAVSEYADLMDYRLTLLELALKAAEASLRAELADNADAFSDAVEEELDALDLYLERLQARAATKAGSARTAAEEAIRDLRRRRNAVARRLEEVRTVRGEAWRELRVGVAAAHVELARAIDEAAAKFD
jgi:hypothetical protein